ncbi:hypothetical protein [Adhaeribacter radiodurans]|nr:hypothetical protein [Adhaeribacter radiodurans]
MATTIAADFVSYFILFCSSISLPLEAAWHGGYQKKLLYLNVALP